MTIRSRSLGTTRCLLAAALFGASAPAASVLVEHLDTFALAGLLYLGAALAVLPSVLRHPPDLGSLRAGWRELAVAVIIGGAVGPALLVAGLAMTSAASASILLNTELVATVVLAAILFREHIGVRVAIGSVLLTLAGAVASWQPGAGLDPGSLLVVAACFCWGIDNCVTARIDQITPEAVVLCKGVFAGGANLLIGLVVAGSSTGPEAFSAGTVALALLVGALGYGASIVLWVRGARDLGAARAQVLFATAPFLGAGVAWLGLREPVAPSTVAAAILAALGVAIAMESAHEHSHRHDPVRHQHEHTHPDPHHDHTHDHEHEGFVGRHDHEHEHATVLEHTHAHVPDLHHRHLHSKRRRKTAREV